MSYSVPHSKCWSWYIVPQTDSVFHQKLQLRTKHFNLMAICGIHRMLLCTLLLLLSFHGKFCDAQESTLTYNVPEGLGGGSRVGDVAADSGTSGPYFFVPSTSEWFEFNLSGVITLLKPLDRETESEYSVLAIPVSGTPAISIDIFVTDENDNRPEFPRDKLNVEFSENVVVGTRRTLDSASDPDLGENSIVGYNITGGNIGEYFRIETIEAFGNAKDLQLDLVVDKRLDREVLPHVDLVILAFDGGNPPLTGSMNVSIEILDVNESPPSFYPPGEVEVNLSESFAVDDRIVQVYANDSDSGRNGLVIYRILETSNREDIFRIDSATGEIFLNKPLNFEDASSYTLLIKARDDGIPPLESPFKVVRITIQNENEHPPSIDVLFTSGDGSPKISEAASLGDFVARISVNDPDDDLENIDVQLIGGQDVFSLTTKDDIIYLICVAEPLDREDVALYDILIRAMDGGSPPLVAEINFTLIVEDINDNPPIFEDPPYTATKSETSLNGTLVATVSATDRDAGINAEVIYSIVDTGEPFADWFVIQSESGMITTAKRLDREEASQVVLTVMASDLGVPSLNSTTTVTVTIADVNDNYPVFPVESYHSNVSEDVPERTCFLQVQATDADADTSGEVTYSTGAGIPSHSQFSIDPNSGDICTTQELDRDGGITSFEFQIRATDGGGLSSVVLVEVNLLDVNDNAPEFYPESYAVDILEFSGRDMVVTSVSAEDRDSGIFGIIRYTIESGNDNQAFRINPNTGDIIVNRTLDGNERNVYLLEVSATDGGGRLSIDNAEVTVSIIGQGDPRPAFVSTRYLFTVPENSEQSYYIGTVEATNSNTGDPSPVEYRIHSGDPHGYFDLDPSTGELTVLSPPDREVQPYALLNIQAASGNPPSYASAQVNVSIEDINDNPPSFQGFAPFTHISENEPRNSVVFIAKALDPDTGGNGVVRYELLENPGETFAITPISGRVTLVQEVNFDQEDKYTLVIRAYDLGTPQLDRTLTFIVYVTDVNNHGPQFDAPSYQETLSESTRIGQNILQVSATDRDSGSNAEIIFSLSPSPAASKFGIFPDTGWIYLHHRLDYELENDYIFEVVAMDNGEEPKSTTAAVHVIVADANDNSPHFDREIYTFREDENVNVGRKIGVVIASDRDSMENGEVTYTMNTDGPFVIGESTGFITTTGTLDYEEQATYTLEVTATDNGNQPNSVSASVVVHINDLNDNAPVFSHPSVYRGTVKEDEPTDTPVLLVVARDADSGVYGDVTYSLEPNVPEFKIDATTGNITTARVLDRETQDSFSLIVMASDGGDPPMTSLVQAEITVRDVNDNAPSVLRGNYTFTVNESDPQGSRIGTIVAFDADSSNTLYYSIVGGNTYGMFAINRTTGVLVNTKEVDFEIVAHHQLQVLVEDQASVRPQSVTVYVEINVLDANDNNPMFQVDPVYVAVMENSPARHPIWTFRATDLDSGPNGDIRYRLVPEQTLLAIDAVTGVLTTSQTIDRETVSEFHFAVEAEDQATGAARRKTTASVVCIVADENDNAPVFTSRSVTHVMEDEPIAYPVIHVTAEDYDSGINGDIVYQIAQGNDDGKFALGPDTGLLTIANSLDHEHRQKYELNITAHDQGVVQLVSWQEVEIYVEDVNDHPPVFQELLYVFNVTEEQDPGLEVGQVVAIDRDSGDNGRLTYELPEGVAANHFEIDSQSGVIRTQVKLDREERDYYSFTVYVMDGAFPSFYDVTTITVYVMDTNDNPPMFASDLFSLQLPEAQVTGIFHVVAAFDPDIQGTDVIRYEIADGNVDDKFDLDSLTGELNTKTTLDREQTPEFNLTVKAIDVSDPGLWTTTVIHIQVLDINDNDPIFVEAVYEVTISEDIQIGSNVIAVQATDRDIGLNGDILYSLDNTTGRLFAVDELTGQIVTAGKFDFEKTDEHAFLVRASDQGAIDQIGPRSEQVQVRVTLLDVNDNAPVFEDKPIRSNISIGTAANSMVATLRADDKDSGVNGEVNYRFMNPSSEFAIDGHVVKTKVTLTEENFYQLKVIAYDSGSPSLSTEASLEIWVSNSNSWTLAFRNSDYRASVQEDAAADTNVLTVDLANRPRDRDIEFCIASGNEMGAFKLLTENGGSTTIQIQNSSTLDYETNPEIILILEARDTAELSIPLYGYTKVTVTLQDANDNAPQFSQDRYSSSVSEGNEAGTFVTQVSATDVDYGSNSDISYHIIGGNTNNVFAIDEVTGIITTNGNLDRELQDLYRLTLRARDNGNPRKDDTVMIKVTVNDRNDNRPIFPIYAPINISEGLEIGSVVTTVTAVDPDINPTITYSFAPGGNQDRMFNIDAYSGTITLAEPLDRERQQSYSLVVTASDSQHSDQSYISVNIQDENDNAPVFTEQSYQVTLPELTPPRHLVMTVNATDADSGENARIKFSMDVPSIQEFSIDRDTGAIYTEQEINYNTVQPVIQLVVTATDNGTPSLSQVVAVRIKVLDVNNNAPEFSKTIYQGSVKENAPEDTLVVTVTASDADVHFANQKIDYSIVSGNEEDKFFISADSGDIKVFNPLDRETTDVYTLIVRAADRGSPQRNSTTEVVIEVLDVNDHAPVFSPSEYSGEIGEGADVGAEIIQVHTFDLDKEENAKVTYDIISGNDKGYFAIDDVSGVITVRRELDHEEMPGARLVVMASDRGMNSSSSNVIVHVNITDENDNRPYFPVMMYLERVAENTPAGVVFTVAALDKDTGIYGQLEYSIVNSKGLEFFDIDARTGEVSSKRAFDYEEAHSYILIIRAMDKGGESLQVQAQVSITGEDEFAPEFNRSSYRFDVPKNANIGDEVGQVGATDMDGGPDGVILYRFQNEQECFEMDELTGRITVRKDFSSDSQRSKRQANPDSFPFIVIGSSGRQGSLETPVSVSVQVAPVPGASARGSSGTLYLIIILIGSAIVVLILVMLFVLVCLMKKRKKKDRADAADLNRSVSPRFYDANFDRNVEMGHGIMNPNITENHMLKGPNSPRVMYGVPPTNSSMEVGHKTDISDQSHSASSGRGSATVEDEEIRQINARTVPRQPRDVLDSGIQQDHDDGSYSASDMNSPRTKPFSTSVESMHVFGDEGGGEAGGQIGHLIYAQLDEAITDEDIAVVDGVNVFGYNNEIQPSMGGSLSSIVNSEEEFSGSYNWDYLLDWGPQFQPLAHVFAEIAKLKDDSLVSSKTESRPFQQKAFQPLNKTYPPPLITNVVHGPIKQLHRSVEQNNSMNHSLNHGNSPRSPISYDHSFIPAAVTPDLSPSLSPLAPGSPSLSPLVTSTGGSSAQSSRRNSGGPKTFVPSRSPRGGVMVTMPPHLTHDAEIQI